MKLINGHRRTIFCLLSDHQENAISDLEGVIRNSSDPSGKFRAKDGCPRGAGNHHLGLGQTLTQRLHGPGNQKIAIREGLGIVVGEWNRFSRNDYMVPQ